MTQHPEARERPGYGQGREALLEAAIRVVSEKGLRNLTYRAVAAEAGVTHGLVAHHFGSRDALIEEALELALTRSLDTAPLNPESGQLEDLGRALPSMVSDDPDLPGVPVRAHARISTSTRDPSLLVKLYAHYRQASRDGLARMGIDDPAIGDLVFAALDGLSFQQVTFGDVEHTERVIERLRDLLAPIAHD